MFFQHRYSVRLTDALIKRIENAVIDNPEVYSSGSHFIRVAIIKELKRVKQ